MNRTCNCSVKHCLLYSIYKGNFTLNNQETNITDTWSKQHTLLQNIQSQKNCNTAIGPETSSLHGPLRQGIPTRKSAACCSGLHDVDTFLFFVVQRGRITDMRHRSASKAGDLRINSCRVRVKKWSVCFRRRGAVDDVLLFSRVKCA
jgi:hypothetical protein